MGIVDHAVRRGLQHPAATSLFKRAQEAVKLEVPDWGVAVLVTTAVVFLLSLVAVEYTLKDVVATLAMVETPAAAITVSASEEQAPKEQKEPLLESGPTITVVHRKPITSTIRGTLKHLVAQAGRFSRFRGFKSFLLYQIAFSFVANIVSLVLPRATLGSMVIISAVTGALLANLHATWTHKVIAMPSQKPFWQRVVPRSQWKRLAIPAAVEASAQYATIYILQGFTILFGLHHHVSRSEVGASTVLRAVSVLVISSICGLFLILPAHVTLTRIEASILPEDDEAIVPFDRTFDGKVVPQILGGSGSIGFIDAWKSFNWEARRRVIKLYIKFFAITLFMGIVMAHVFAFELWAIMGPAIGKFLAEAKQQGAQ